MRRNLRPIFWLEATLAGISAALFVLTLLWKDWIEIVFGFDPDNRSGALEWALVAVLVTITVGLSALARSEWRRALPSH